MCNSIVGLNRGIPNEYCSNCFRKSKLITGIKTCVMCGKEFKYKNSLQMKNKTCSKECGYKLVSKKVKDFHNSLTNDEKIKIKEKMCKTKIKNGTTGKGKTPWNKNKTGIYSEKTIEKIRNATIKQMHESRVKKTKCEFVLENILKELSINYRYSFVINDRQFDFCLLDYNILVECDGDYWHGNLSTGKYKNPNPTQLKNMINDLYKTILAQVSGFIILRFWEAEIINYPDIVKEKINAITLMLEDNQHPSLLGN